VDELLLVDDEVGNGVTSALMGTADGARFADVVVSSSVSESEQYSPSNQYLDEIYLRAIMSEILAFFGCQISFQMVLHSLWCSFL